MPETDARMLNTVTISSAQPQRAARLSSPKSETRLSPTKAALSCLVGRISYFASERRFTVRHTHGSEFYGRARYVSRA